CHEVGGRVIRIFPDQRFIFLQRLLDLSSLRVLHSQPIARKRILGIGGKNLAQPGKAIHKEALGSQLAALNIHITARVTMGFLERPTWLALSLCRGKSRTTAPSRILRGFRWERDGLENAAPRGMKWRPPTRTSGNSATLVMQTPVRIFRRAGTGMQFASRLPALAGSRSRSALSAS